MCHAQDQAFIRELESELRGPKTCISLDMCQLKARTADTSQGTCAQGKLAQGILRVDLAAPVTEYPFQCMQARRVRA